MHILGLCGLAPFLGAVLAPGSTIRMMDFGSAQGKQLESGPWWQNWLTLLVTLQLLFSVGIQLRRLLLLFQSC